MDLRLEFDRVFDPLIKHHISSTAPSLLAVVPPIETWVDTDDKEFHLSMPLPGLKPEEINFNLQGNRFTFSGEPKDEQNKTGKDYWEGEFFYGCFVSSVALPEGVDGKNLTAELKDRVLEVKTPISAASPPWKMEIKTAPKAQAVGGELLFSARVASERRRGVSPTFSRDR